MATRLLNDGVEVSQDRTVMTGFPTRTEQSTAGKEHQMAGKKPDYRVFVSRTGTNKESFFTEIGAAWNVAKDGISIQLHAVPLDGRIVLFPPKADEE